MRNLVPKITFTRRRKRAGAIALMLFLSVVLSAAVFRPVSAAITYQNSVTGTAANSASVTSASVAGGSNMFFVAVVANRAHRNTTAVSGGSLLWSERVDACSGGSSIQGVSIWTAYGTASSFTVSATLASSSVSSVISVTWYSGVSATSPIEDVVYRNVNGESGSCNGGSADSTTSLTTGSTATNSIHFVAVNVRQRTITTADVDYTQRATDASGSGTDQTRLYIHDRTKATTGDDTASHTLNNTAQWVSAGFIIRPHTSTGGSSTLNQKAYRWYDNANSIQPTTAMAAESAAGIIYSESEVARLRMGLEVGGGATLAAGSTALKLQYATSTAGPWADVASSPATWFDNNYGYRLKLTIDAGKVAGSSDLTDFPMLVSITDDSLRTTGNGGNVTSANGYDIIFTDAVGSPTQWDHEIESYNANTGTIVMWVKVPILDHDNNTDFFIYYGNGTVTTSQEDVNAVWTAGYNGVWHLDENPAPKSSPNGCDGGTKETCDSTNTGIHGDSGGGMTGSNQVAGKVNGSYDFDGSDDIIDFGDRAETEFTGDFVVSTWIKTSSGSGFPSVIEKWTGAGTEWAWHLTLNGFSANKATCAAYTNGPQNRATSTTSVTDGNWHYIQCVRDGNDIKIYVDGVLEDTTADVTGTLANAGTLKFSYEYDGLMDEVRMSPVGRTEGWLLTEYNNMLDPSSFYTIGGTETSGGSAWKYHDNPSATNGAAVSSTLLSASDTAANYAESNPTSTNPNAISNGNQGEWDFSIVPDDNFVPETVYYFRAITSLGVALDTYTAYPEICLDSVPSTGSRMRHGSWFTDDTKQAFSAETAVVSVCGA